MPVEFVGHPLIDLIPPPADRVAVLREAGLDPERPVLAVLPGSRHNEVHKILPDLVTALPLLAERVPGIQALVARAPNLDDALFAPLAAARADGRVPIAVLDGRADDVLSASDVVLTASGTATVQTALHEKPMVIVYRVSELSYFLGRRFVKVDTFGMANLIAGRTVATELIQDFFSPARVAEEVARLFNDPEAAEAMCEAWRDVKRRLGGGGASGRAADAILRGREARPLTRAAPHLGSRLLTPACGARAERRQTACRHRRSCARRRWARLLQCAPAWLGHSPATCRHRIDEPPIPPACRPAPSWPPCSSSCSSSSSRWRCNGASTASARCMAAAEVATAQ